MSVVAVAEVPVPPGRIRYQQHCSNCGHTGHRCNHCPESPRAKSVRLLPPRRSKVENENDMLRELAAELTPPGQELVSLQVARKHLPIARDTDDIRRPRWRSECVPCPTCQEWRDAGAGSFVGRMPCTHNFDEAVAHSRPCVFTLCKANLFSEIKPSAGSLTLVFGDVNPADVEGPSCEEDESARGGMTLEEVGAILGITRERVRQVEVVGLRKMKAQTRHELGLPPGR